MASAGVVGVDRVAIGESARDSGDENGFGRPIHESLGAASGLKRPNVGTSDLGIGFGALPKALPCLLWLNGFHNPGIGGACGLLVSTLRVFCGNRVPKDHVAQRFHR